MNIVGLTINWEIYENIDLEEDELAINLTIDKLYAFGSDLYSGIPNLYMIDISLS